MACTYVPVHHELIHYVAEVIKVYQTLKKACKLVNPVFVNSCLHFVVWSLKVHIHCLAPDTLKAVLSINLKTGNHPSVLFFEAVLFINTGGKYFIWNITAFFL